MFNFEFEFLDARIRRPQIIHSSPGSFLDTEVDVSKMSEGVCFVCLKLEFRKRRSNSQWLMSNEDYRLIAVFPRSDLTMSNMF